MGDAKSLMNTTMPLSQAVKKAPNVSSCYQIYYGDELVYVGKAQDGIRKRFVQYYHGTTAHYSSAQKIFENKDALTVKWKVIEEPALVVEQEAKWIRNYKPVWNNQSGWGDKGVLAKGTAGKVDTGCYTKTGTKDVVAVKKGVITPEMELAGMLGNSMLTAATTAVIGTAVTETVKSLRENDDATATIGNVAGKGTQAALAGAGGALASELAGLAAISMGAGPVGWIIAATIAGGVTTTVISNETGELAGEIADTVSDFVDDLRIMDPKFDEQCTILENVGFELSYLWDCTIGSWFL